MHTSPSSALPEDGDVARISPKLCNVLLNPAQSHHLVFQAVVTGNYSVASTQESWTVNIVRALLSVGIVTRIREGLPRNCASIPGNGNSFCPVYVLGGLYGLAFLARGELCRHRIRNWYVYRVSRDIERSFSINNDPAISTTRGDTRVDAVFTRHVEYLQTMNFVSYFSYHKPLLSITAQPHSVTCDDIPVQWFLWEIIIKYINKCRLRHIHDPVFLS